MEWQAYSTLEPFGPRAEHWQAASICAAIANVNRGKKTKPYKPEDFMPAVFTKDEPRELSAEQKAQLLTHNFESYQRAQQRMGQ